MKKLMSLLLALALLCAAALPVMAEETDRAEALRASFLAKADEVIVNDNSVVFPDAASETPGNCQEPVQGRRAVRQLRHPVV